MDSGLDPDRPVLLPLVLKIYENTLPPAHDPVPLPGYAVSQRCMIYPSRCLGSNLPQGVGNHIVSRHPEKQGARGIDLNGGNWSSTWQRYPCLSLPLHPPTYQWCYPGHPMYYPTHGSTPSSISSRHITSTLRIATQKLGFQKLGFFPHKIGYHSLQSGRHNNTSSRWSSGTHHKDYWKVAIICLPHLPIGLDHHFHPRCCRSNGKSALVQTHHRT